MNSQELQTLIDSDAEATALFTAMDDVACASRCSAIAPKLRQETVLTERGLYLVLGPTVAETILQKLAGFAAASQEASPIIARVINWLNPNNGGVDFGNAQSLQLVGMLTQGGLFTAEEFTAIDNMSLASQVITSAQIERLRLGL